MAVAGPKKRKAVGAFGVKDCALAAVATGRLAQNLKELRDELEAIDPASIYYHFWGGLLRPSFDDPRYSNDFARWAHAALHNQPLAERLNVIDPAEFADLEALRAQVVAVVDDELDRSDVLPWALGDQAFHFVRSQIVVFDTRRTVARPGGLPDAIAAMTPSSVFFHFIDARNRTPRSTDDFSAWLSDLGRRYEPAVSALAAVDPYFDSLVETRGQLVAALRSRLPREEP